MAVIAAVMVLAVAVTAFVLSPGSSSAGAAAFELIHGSTTLKYLEAERQQVIAMTDAGYDLHGNHCWNGATPPAGTLVIQQFDTSNVVVQATFDNFAMHSCTDDSACTVSGTIVTTGSGVFD